MNIKPLDWKQIMDANKEVVGYYASTTRGMFNIYKCHSCWIATENDYTENKTEPGYFWGEHDTWEDAAKRCQEIHNGNVSEWLIPADEPPSS